MKALTIWQPWATLIMIGAKPYEFRRWDFRERERHLVGQRIVIHAGARPVNIKDVFDIHCRVATGDSSLIPEKTLPLIERLLAASKCKGVVELSAALGTAVLGRPRDVNALFKTPDSDRVDHHMWAWPLTEIEAFDAPVPCRGAQGFWNYGGRAPA